MVQGKKSKQAFNERMQREADLKAAVAAKKARQRGESATRFGQSRGKCPILLTLLFRCYCPAFIPPFPRREHILDMCNRSSIGTLKL